VGPQTPGVLSPHLPLGRQFFVLPSVAERANPVMRELHDLEIREKPQTGAVLPPPGNKEFQ